MNKKKGSDEVDIKSVISLLMKYQESGFRKLCLRNDDCGIYICDDRKTLMCKQTLRRA